MEPSTEQQLQQQRFSEASASVVIVPEVSFEQPTLGPLVAAPVVLHAPLLPLNADLVNTLQEHFEPEWQTCAAVPGATFVIGSDSFLGQLQRHETIIPPMNTVPLDLPVSASSAAVVHFPPGAPLASLHVRLTFDLQVNLELLFVCFLFVFVCFF